MTKSNIAPAGDDGKSLAFHPIADMFPLMEGEDFAAFAANIGKEGLNEPIVLYEDTILDGRNRYRACVATLVEPKYRYPDAVAFAISANIRRRHLTAEQKREIIEKLLKANPEKSDRSIAKIAKVGKNVINRTRKKMESTGTVGPVEKRVGADGKSRKQPVTVDPIMRRPSWIPKLGTQRTPQEKKSTLSGLEEEHQETLYDQACRFLKLMTDETRQRFFAHIKPAADDPNQPKSAGSSPVIKLTIRLLTDLIAHGLRADPIKAAQAMRMELAAEPITKLIGWLDQFMTEIKKNPRSNVVVETDTVH